MEQERNRLTWKIDDTQQATNPEDAQTCPSRMGEMGPWKREENLDRWERVGQDRCCSFCGSIHPDDLNTLLDDETTKISISDKPYKVYINRPGVRNAKEGAIKYYTWHRYESDDAANALLKKLNDAARRSLLRYVAIGINK